METEQITQALIDDGWKIEPVCIDAGGYDEPSRFHVRLTRDGYTGHYETTYTKGSGLRVWKRTPLRSIEQVYYGFGEAKKGKRVQSQLRRIDPKHPANAEAIKWFNTNTEPEPVTLEDFLWSINLDAGSVRDGQTFEDFCAGCGDGNTDSIKNKAAFDACRDAHAALVRLGADFDKLAELFQDY